MRELLDLANAIEKIRIRRRFGRLGQGFEANVPCAA
jgi:hypothetical protein